MRTNDHRLAERRSLELHRAVVERLRREPGLLDKARQKVAAWLETGEVARPYALAWQDILGSPLPCIEQRLLDPSDAGAALRQTTPFSFVVGPRERWGIWRTVRERWEVEP